ncbi:MAG: 50S ribosomal protein L21 [Candidatus Woesebacteria bacterium GW2011_GWB1_38_5]|uniref:Large ribosomal subunit protein bL21 n=4 Tax=Candidatus Woeseibacteriota TaxID=1752722 RepID=A0A0G0MIJ7_9BACT|nr:MAG: 50S ribosomal protein L21 [Candidatus Woesebacteria bacterium GW2011_GWD1_38_10]KKQ56241.1 MAG: 50S ribosomal protein L21 [Candidatus Woesebacteria bacterium GW2011_GWC1_38_13]KKQ73574.1 MAG: 50S ribosomal protein L21 [Candidatus Woesebacteria bacterium GW2011_GWB1_38_5]KKQ84772.1 MAG: 50S ribosomal protein L21 [Candidatus Woesebacteria bacterium GW2011_GWA1_38_8]
MVKYAVIKIKGKQYRVSEGDKIVVDRAKDELNENTLLLRDDEKLMIGKPYLDKVKVVLSKIKDFRGKKIEVFKYKAKSRYRKHSGFRAELTELSVEKITS